MMERNKKMKVLFRIWLMLIAFALSATTFSCAWVTETGNPTQAGEGPSFAPDDADRGTYENDALGVTINFPGTWTFVEEFDEAAADGGGLNDVIDQEVVEFMSEEHEDGTTTATIFFEILDPRPVSLFSYLFGRFPGRTFEPFATTTLSGFIYDDPAVGPNGGELEEYYFLDVDLFIRIEAEIFPSSRAEFNSLLEGISFQ
jgi:hypothetical protein